MESVLESREREWEVEELQEEDKKEETERESDENDDKFNTYMIKKYETLSNNIASLLFKEELADVQIYVGDPQIKIFAHRQILASSSPVFSKMLYGKFAEGIKREIKIPNIEPVVLKALLNFIYTATLEVDEAILVPLIIATDQYQIKGAKEELEKAAHFFISKASKDPQSISKVLKILCDSAATELDELQKICLDFIDIHAEDIFNSDSFLELPKQILCLILQRDSLSDEVEEVQLYLAVLRWARGRGNINSSDPTQFDVSEINSSTSKDLKEILSYIRFPIIPAPIIISKIAPSKLIDVEELYLATAFHAAPKCFEKDTRAIFRQRHGPNVRWYWSKDNHGSHIVRSNSNRTVLGCHYDWEKCMGNIVWRSGRHKFNLLIEMNMLASNNTWQIIIGISHPSNTNYNTFLGSTKSEWGIMCLSGQKINANIVDDYTSGFRRGDTITVLIDLNNGTLEYFRNSVSLGVAFKNIKGPVSPCIGLLKGQKVTLVYESH